MYTETPFSLLFAEDLMKDALADAEYEHPTGEGALWEQIIATTPGELFASLSKDEKERIHAFAVSVEQMALGIDRKQMDTMSYRLVRFSKGSWGYSMFDMRFLHPRAREVDHFARQVATPNVKISVFRAKDGAIKAKLLNFPDLRSLV